MLGADLPGTAAVRQEGGICEVNASDGGTRLINGRLIVGPVRWAPRSSFLTVFRDLVYLREELAVRSINMEHGSITLINAIYVYDNAAANKDICHA